MPAKLRQLREQLRDALLELAVVADSPTWRPRQPAADLHGTAVSRARSTPPIRCALEWVGRQARTASNAPRSTAAASAERWNIRSSLCGQPSERARVEPSCGSWSCTLFAFRHESSDPAFRIVGLLLSGPIVQASTSGSRPLRGRSRSLSGRPGHLAYVRVSMARDSGGRSGAPYSFEMSREVRQPSRVRKSWPAGCLNIAPLQERLAKCAIRVDNARAGDSIP
jgi:hypothetical protein